MGARHVDTRVELDRFPEIGFSTGHGTERPSYGPNAYNADRLGSFTHPVDTNAEVRTLWSNIGDQARARLYDAHHAKLKANADHVSPLMRQAPDRPISPVFESVQQAAHLDRTTKYALSFNVPSIDNHPGQRMVVLSRAAAEHLSQVFDTYLTHVHMNQVKRK